MMRLAFVSLLVLCLSSCDRSHFDGFTKHENGVHFKLLAIGNEAQPLDRDVYASLEMYLKNQDDSIIARKTMRRVIWGTASIPANLKIILAEGGAGDSIAFKGQGVELQLQDLFRPMPISEVDTFQLEVVVTEVVSFEELQQIKAEERAAKDNELLQYKRTQDALDSLKLNEDHFLDGIYFKMLRTGDGKRPSSGSIAFVHYKNHLADGSLIYDTYQVEPFEYHIGKPDQVIPGFAVALSHMRVGGKALFLIPHDMAFGESGSSSGIVPPFSAVIYEAELIEVRD